MSQKIYEVFLAQLLATKEPILIPNDPVLTGTADWQPRKPLTKTETLFLENVLSLIKDCKPICKDILPSSNIAGVYQKDKIFIEVSDEWNVVTESVEVYVIPVSKDFTKKYLIREIEELNKVIRSLVKISNNVAASPINADRNKQIRKLVSDRIRRTTLSKFSGWGAQTRSADTWRTINRFVDLLDVYPTDDQILQMSGMIHPQINSRLSDLRDEIEIYKKKISIPASEIFEDLTNEELLLYEAIVEYCRSIQFIGAYLDENQDEILVWETEDNLIVEVILSEVESLKFGKIKTPRYIWSTGDVDLTEIDFSKELSSKYHLLASNNKSLKYIGAKHLLRFIHDPTLDWIKGVGGINEMERLIEYEENLKLLQS